MINRRLQKDSVIGDRVIQLLVIVIGPKNGDRNTPINKKNSKKVYFKNIV